MPSRLIVVLLIYAFLCEAAFANTTKLEMSRYSDEECLDWPFDFSGETPQLTRKLRKTYSTSVSPDKNANTSIGIEFWDEDRRQVGFHHEISVFIYIVTCTIQHTQDNIIGNNYRFVLKIARQLNLGLVQGAHERHVSPDANPG